MATDITLPVEFARLPFFNQLPAPGLQQVMAIAGRRTIQRGDYFFMQDDPADTLYLLTSGQLRLTQLTSDGMRVILHMAVPGNLFGAVALLQDRRYPVGAQAVTAAEAIVWAADALRRVADDYPIILTSAMQMMSANMQQVQTVLRSISTEKVEKRIARTLLQLAADHSVPHVSGGSLINFALSREDLADMCGTTHFAVSRLLKQWERNHWIELGRQRVVVLNPQQLHAVLDN